MRIGDILLERGWVDPTDLSRALAEQRHTTHRVCSLLVARGLLDPDHAARALGEQHQVAAALQRHLEHRDRALASLLPAAAARTHVALPLGRMRAGELIVCVRDPRPELAALLARAIGEPIVLAVAPAQQLERLVDATYERGEPGEVGDFDVDLSTGPIPTLHDAPAVGAPGLADLGSLADLAAVSGLSLVGLDDHRVTKDYSQSGPPTANRAVAAAPPVTRPIPISVPIVRVVSLVDTIDALARSTSRDAASDEAMQFAASRWCAALLLTVKDGAALGHRGHGAQLAGDAVQGVVLPLGSSSIVRSAHDARRLVTEPPSGAIQDRLGRLLGQPARPAAAPVIVGRRVACVLAVGDPIAGDADHAADLEQLADALGAAYTRILRDRKA